MLELQHLLGTINPAKPFKVWKGVDAFAVEQGDNGYNLPFDVIHPSESIMKKFLELPTEVQNEILRINIFAHLQFNMGIALQNFEGDMLEKEYARTKKVEKQFEELKKKFVKENPKHETFLYSFLD